MCTTNVADITRNMIREWYYHLRFVNSQHFEIDFALAHLERVVVPAFFGSSSSKNRRIPGVLNQRIQRLQQEVIKVNSKLEKCEEYGRSSTKSGFMKDCLNTASRLIEVEICISWFVY
ncbi:LOW QUALITY PROTEIN: hypothetical protein TorRG33x02_295410 [Trema orientale]|uniref:Uncharacterized protein n=1 Tax=Trema orientale TaxID=63057 RepID=A0A2P5C6T4_TREOI|nr:LOW QUALITY PROTEIN: hypothetical protein TorRG33x02_295410 [Trema orientale]